MGISFSFWLIWLWLGYAPKKFLISLLKDLNLPTDLGSHVNYFKKQNLSSPCGDFFIFTI